MPNSDPRASDTRDAILRAVLLEVWDRGLSQVTLKAVASRAGVGISLITHYFPSKEALLEEATGQWRDALLGFQKEVMEVYRKAEGRDEALSAAMRRCMQVAREDQVFMKMLLRSVVVRGELPESVASASFPIGDEVAKILAAAHGAGFWQARAVVHQASILITRLSLLTDQELLLSYEGETAEECWEACCRATAKTIVGAINAPWER